MRENFKLRIWRWNLRFCERISPLEIESEVNLEDSLVIYETYWGVLLISGKQFLDAFEVFKVAEDKLTWLDPYVRNWSCSLSYASMLFCELASILDVWFLVCSVNSNSGKTYCQYWSPFRGYFGIVLPYVWMKYGCAFLTSQPCCSGSRILGSGAIIKRL